MRWLLVFHIVAGTVGLVSGFIVLYAAKGARLHRKGGMVFVYAMVSMAALGALIAALRAVAPAVNIPAGLMTGYFVITALRTVRTCSQSSRWLDVGLMLLALIVSVTDLRFATQALTSANGRSHGFPPFPFLLFGIVGSLAVIGDVRVLRHGALRGAPRIARHLWRMSFALLIASLSFFIGQAKIIPKPYRVYPLLALPILVVLVTMLYWMWRVRFKRSLRGMVRVTESVALPEHA